MAREPAIDINPAERPPFLVWLAEQLQVVPQDEGAKTIAMLVGRACVEHPEFLHEILQFPGVTKAFLSDLQVRTYLFRNQEANLAQLAVDINGPEKLEKLVAALPNDADKDLLNDILKRLISLNEDAATYRNWFDDEVTKHHATKHELNQVNAQLAQAKVAAEGSARNIDGYHRLLSERDGIIQKVEHERDEAYDAADAAHWSAEQADARAAKYQKQSKRNGFLAVAAAVTAVVVSVTSNWNDLKNFITGKKPAEPTPARLTPPKNAAPQPDAKTTEANLWNNNIIDNKKRLMMAGPEKVIDGDLRNICKNADVLLDDKNGKFISMVDKILAHAKMGEYPEAARNMNILVSVYDNVFFNTPEQQARKYRNETRQTLEGFAKGLDTIAERQIRPEKER